MPTLIRACIAVMAITIALTLSTAPAAAQDTILYTSQPDRVAVFLNDIAYVQDDITLPGGVAVQVALPPTAFPDTLILYEDDTRVQSYRLRQQGGQLVLQWESAAEDVVQVQLQYLMRGITWKPTYDMFLQDEENVTFDFYAEIINNNLHLDDVAVTLIAGQVDTAQQIDTITTITTNQVIFNYAEDGAFQGEVPAAPPANLGAGRASIQHVYDAARLTAVPGDIVYTRILTATLTARRGLVWNATASQEIDVIYKVNNDTVLPFAQGVVRNYEDGLFLGSDFIEQTPIGSEGSVTVGNFQDARVIREAFDTFLGGPVNERDRRTDVSLRVSNFSAETITVEVVDSYPSTANGFEFNIEGERSGDNRMSWTLDIPPGETIAIEYSYLS